MKLDRYANQLELLGILKEWNEKRKGNAELGRVIVLVQDLIFDINNLEIEIEDLKVMNSAIRDHKNKEILKLKGCK
jgi:hypothetical protein